MFFLQLGFERILPGSSPAFLPLISTEAKKLKTGSGPNWALFPSPCPLPGAPDPGLQCSRCASPAPRGEEEEEEEEAKFGGQILPSALPTRPRFRTESSPSPRVNNTRRKGREAARAGLNPPCPLCLPQGCGGMHGHPWMLGHRQPWLHPGENLSSKLGTLVWVPLPAEGSWAGWSVWTLAPL